MPSCRWAGTQVNCSALFGSGRSAAWLARLVRDQEVGGSNPLAPTILFNVLDGPLDGPAGLSPGALVRSASKNDVYKPNGTASQSQEYLQSPSARCILLGPMTHFSGNRVNQALGVSRRRSLLSKASAARLSRYHQMVPATKIQITTSVPYFDPKAKAGAETGRSASRMNVNSIPTN